jgi:hypothetical protein
LPAGTGLVAGMIIFALSMAALVGWLIFGGPAGKERGLAFQNLTQQTMILKFDDGRVTKFAPGAQQTLLVKPAQFPQDFTVTDASGNTLYTRRFAFSEFKTYSFQIGIDQGAFKLYEGVDAPATY